MTASTPEASTPDVRKNTQLELVKVAAAAKKAKEDGNADASKSEGDRMTALGKALSGESLPAAGKEAFNVALEEQQRLLQAKSPDGKAYADKLREDVQAQLAKLQADANTEEARNRIVAEVAQKIEAEMAVSQIDAADKRVLADYSPISSVATLIGEKMLEASPEVSGLPVSNEEAAAKRSSAVEAGIEAMQKAGFPPERVYEAMRDGRIEHMDAAIEAAESLRQSLKPVSDELIAALPTSEVRNDARYLRLREESRKSMGIDSLQEELQQLDPKNPEHLARIATLNQEITTKTKGADGLALIAAIDTLAGDSKFANDPLIMLYKTYQGQETVSLDVASSEDNVASLFDGINVPPDIHIEGVVPGKRGTLKEWWQGLPPSHRKAILVMLIAYILAQGGGIPALFLIAGPAQLVTLGAGGRVVWDWRQRQKEVATSDSATEEGKAHGGAPSPVPPDPGPTMTSGK